MSAKIKIRKIRMMKEVSQWMEDGREAGHEAPASAEEQTVAKEKERRESECMREGKKEQTRLRLQAAKCSADKRCSNEKQQRNRRKHQHMLCKTEGGKKTR